MFRFKSIYIKLSLIIIIIITVILSISSTVIYFEFRGILLKRTLDDQKSVLLQNKMNIENLANSINQTTGYLYTDKTIAEILMRNSDNYLQLVSDRTDLRELFANYAATPVSTNVSTYFAVLYINDNFAISHELDSYNLGDETSGLVGVYNTKSISDTAWYKNTLERNGSLYTFLIERDTSRVYVARLIRNKNLIDPQNGDEIGVVVIGIDRKSFKDQIESSKLTKSTRVLLVNKDGSIIYSNDEKIIGTDILSLPMASAIKSFKSSESCDFTYENKKYITTVYSLYWDWKLISMIPYSDITEGLNVVLRIIVITSIIGLFLGIVLSIVLSNTISKPIRKLAKIMQGISDESNMDIFIDSKFKDEVGVLYKSFNSMMKRINKLVSDVYESSRKQKNAELKALQAQINPHFVYNTLDAANWLLLCKNEDNIATMISSLAYIFRYSIKNADEKVKLEEEIKHIEKYISIQAIRYENSFDVEYRIEPEALECMLPKFIIQPLVENAIVHGIKKTDRRGLIILSAKKEINELTISLEDNGEGADTVELNNYLNGKVTTLVDSDGFGIKNVNERLKLNYGDSYTLNYLKNEVYGLTVYVRIPFD